MLPSAQTPVECARYIQFEQVRSARWLSSFLVMVMVLMIGEVRPSAVLAQASATRLVYPIGDFHVGKRLMFDGLTAAASHAFETSYRLSRTLDDQHGIDAVPSLCRNGQALYLSGDLTGALSNLNAGLSLSYASRFWTAYIDQIPIVLRPVEISDGRIAWVAEQRVSRLAIYPDAWPVVIGATSVIVEAKNPVNGLNLSYEPIFLDAVETFLSQAVALRIRNRLLGSLTEHYSLSKQLESMYAEVNPRMPEMLQRCQNICHAITLNGIGRSRQAKTLLEQNLTLDTGFDFPLTSIALLELANIAIDEKDFAQAKLRAGQASLLAARLQQFDILAESLDVLTNCADYEEPGQGLRIAENVLRWMEADFGLVYLTTLSNACHSAALSRNINAYNLHSTKFDRAIRIKEVLLPHLQASVFASRIKLNMSKNNPDNAKTSLKQLIGIATGSDTPTAILPQLVQATSIQIANREGNMPKKVLFAELSKLVQRPTDSQWMRDPWGSMVWDNLPLNDLYAMQASYLAASGTPEEFVQLLSDWHERQLRIQDPLLERALAFRRLLQYDAAKLSAEQKPAVEKLQARYNSLTTRSALLNERFTQLKLVAKPDGSDWSNDWHREWSQLVGLCTSQSKDYFTEASGTIHLPSLNGESIDFASLRNDLSDEQAIVGFFKHENMLWGYYISKVETQYWVIPNDKNIVDLQMDLLRITAVYSDVPTLLKSLESPQDWLGVSAELTSALIPAEIEDKLSTAKQVSIVPFGRLWLLPFEMLSSGGNLATDVWLSRFAISYSLSLRSAAFSQASRETLTKVVYSRPNFFSVENQVDSALQKSILESFDPQQTAFVTLTKENAANHPFPIAAARSVIVASDLVLQTPDTTGMVRQKDQALSILDPSMIDLVRPKELLFLDIQQKTAERAFDNPELIASWLQSQRYWGIDTLLWRQWPVNGESTEITAKELFTRTNQSFATALQSSVLNLWEVDLNSVQEQRFSAPTRRGNAQLLSGKMPIFWAGWKVTTNYPVPVKTKNEVVERN